MSNDHFIVKLIALGVDKGVKGVTQQEYEAWEKLNSLSDDDIKQSNALLHQCFDTINKRDGSYVFLLKAEHYFNHVDHLELVEARKNAKEARWFSVLAIGISVAAVLISVFSTVSLSDISIAAIHEGINKNIENDLQP